MKNGKFIGFLKKMFELAYNSLLQIFENFINLHLDQYQLIGFISEAKYEHNKQCYIEH